MLQHSQKGAQHRKQIICCQIKFGHRSFLAVVTFPMLGVSVSVCPKAGPVTSYSTPHASHGSGRFRANGKPNILPASQGEAAPHMHVAFADWLAGEDLEFCVGLRILVANHRRSWDVLEIEVSLRLVFLFVFDSPKVVFAYLCLLCSGDCSPIARQVPEDLDSEVTAKDGDRVLICGCRHVDTDLLQIGAVSKVKLAGSPEMVYVCQKRLTLRGRTSESQLTFSEDLHGYSQCLVLGGSGGVLEMLRLSGVQRCPLEQISGEWLVSKCTVKAPPGRTTWDAFTACGGSTTFRSCQLIGGHGVMTLYPVDLSYPDTRGATQTHVTLERCVVKDAKFNAVTAEGQTCIVATNCVFLRNGQGASQLHIEFFSLLAYARRILPQIQLLIAKFIDGLAPNQLQAPASTASNDMGCVFSLALGSSAKIVNCQFGANSVVVRNHWQGAWWTWRGDAPRISATGNVSASGEAVLVCNVMHEPERSTLAMCEAERDRKGGLGAWGVSPEEEQRILQRENERTQPPWLPQ